MSMLMSFCPIINIKVSASGEDNLELSMYLEGSKIEYEFVTMEDYKLISLNHHANGVLIKRIPPTCTKRGYDVYKVCFLGESKIYVVEIPPTGHNYSKKWKVSKQATCIEAGEEYRICKNKGCKSVDKREIQPTGHNFSDEWIVGEEPTCTQPGEEYKQCQNNGCTERETREMQPTGHNFSDEWLVEKEPTCTQPGEEYKQCQNNGCTERETREIQPTGHNFSDEWLVEKEPTCTQPGEEYKQCQNNGCTERETREIQATGHNYNENIIPPSCTEKGYTEHTCIKGDNSYRDNYVDELGHEPGDWDIIKAPTEQEEGIKQKKCKRCNAVLEEEAIQKLNPRGNIDVLIESPNDITVQTNLEELKEAALSNEDEQLLDNGNDLTIILRVKRIENSSDRALIEESLEGMTCGCYFDISVVKIINNQEINIDKLNKSIKILIRIPEELKGHDNYKFIRADKGEVVVLDDMDNSAETILIETDRFSTYALAYSDNGTMVASEDTGIQSDSDVSDNTIVTESSTVNTGDNSNIIVLFGCLLLSSLSVLVLRKKEKIIY